MSYTFFMYDPVFSNSMPTWLQNVMNCYAAAAIFQQQNRTIYKICED